MALVQQPQRYGAVAITGGAVVASPTAGDGSSVQALRVNGPAALAVAICNRKDLEPIGEAAAALVTTHSPYVSWIPRIITSQLLSTDPIAGTFWVPGPGDLQTPSLLRTLHTRGASAKTFVLVHSRPDAELRRNFSLCNGLNIDIGAPRFRLSRTSIALQVINDMPDDVAMSSSQFKRELISGLPNLKVDEFFLLRYRDYSEWAAVQYPTEAKRDVALGPLYVERCFALRVGNNPGVFIPITERQLVMGYEILQQREVEHAHELLQQDDDTGGVGGGLGAQKRQRKLLAEPSRHALNEDQFRSLGGAVEALLAVFAKDAMQEQLAEAQLLLLAQQEATLRLQQAAGGGGGAGGGFCRAYVAPAWYDWTPSAIQRRVTHALEEQYKSVGRFVVKTLLVGLFVYCGVALVRRGLGVDDGRRLPPPPPQGRRGGRAGRGSSTADGGESGSGGGVVGSVIRSVFAVGPKQLMDFVLSPSAAPA